MHNWFYGWLELLCIFHRLASLVLVSIVLLDWHPFVYVYLTLFTLPFVLTFILGAQKEPSH